MDMNSATLDTNKDEILYSDYMRNEWNVLYIELPDGDGLVQFFDSRQDVAGSGRYITAARVSELLDFVKRAGKREYYRTDDGTKIARKKLDNVLKWVAPRFEQTVQRQIDNTSSMLFAAMHNMARLSTATN